MGEETPLQIAPVPINKKVEGEGLIITDVTAVATQLLASVIVTVYVPVANKVVVSILTFCVEAVNAFGPVQA